MTSWRNNGYLAQQRKRLPRHKYRRLHLNLPGAPDGAAYDGDKIMAAIFTGRKRLAPEKGIKYFAFVDMSGGSSDDAVLGISHFDAERKIAILDCLVAQTGTPPFNPRLAVKKFATVCREYGVSKATGDRYAGETSVPISRNMMFLTTSPSFRNRSSTTSSSPGSMPVKSNCSMTPSYRNNC